MGKNEELQKWLNDDRYVHLSKLAAMWNLSNSGTLCFLRRRNIVSLKVFHCGHRGRYAFYDLKKCESAREAMHQEISYANDYENNQILVAPHELAILWGFTRSSAASFLNRRNIKPVKKFEFGGRRGTASFYDRAECERARPFINQSEQKEVEKQMELPEPKEQTPDIIPADTIDLFTMSELESELKNRGVELTSEVRAKINASDMPEMQHIATMLRGNTKTIAIRLSVLNEIAGQLREVKKAGFNWDKWLNPEIEKKEQIKESVLEPEPVFNTEYAKEMFYLLKEVDKNIDNEDIPCEIKEIKKVFARHGSINATECRSVLKKHGYVGMTDAGYLLGMSYAEINNYQKLFLPDYLITLGYDTIAKYKNGRCTSPIWNKTRVDKHFEEIKKNNDFRLDLVKSEISRMGENSRDRLLKMSELDKTSVSEKLDRIISAAWIMGNYDKK